MPFEAKGSFEIRGELNIKNVQVPPAPIITVGNIDISIDDGVPDDFRVLTQVQDITGTLSVALLPSDTLWGTVDDGATWTDITSFIDASSPFLDINWTNVSLVPGPTYIKFKVIDEFDQEGPESSQWIELIVTPLHVISDLALSDDDGIPGDFITTITAQTITATLSIELIPGTDVLYGSVDTGTSFTNITNKVSTLAISWDGATLSGSQSIHFKVVNEAGTGPITEQPYQVLAVPATTIGGIEISEDSGTFDDDFITNVALQDITATLSAVLVIGEELHASVDAGISWVAIETFAVVGTAIAWNNVNLIPGSGKSIKFKVVNVVADGPVETQGYILDTSWSSIFINDIDIEFDDGPSDTDFVTSVEVQNISAALSAILSAEDILYGSTDAGVNWANITSNVSGTIINWLGATLIEGTALEMIIQFKIGDLAGNFGATYEQAYTYNAGPTPLLGETAIFNGGRVSPGFAYVTTLEYINIPSLSDAIAFGVLNTEREAHSSASNGSNGRGAVASGSDGINYLSTAEYFTINTPSNAVPLGTMNDVGSVGAATSNGSSDRGVFFSGLIGVAANAFNIIEYITISVGGTATDYADMAENRYGFSALSNGTGDRAVIGEGTTDINSPPYGMDYKTISTTATAVHFGNLLNSHVQETQAMSSSTNQRGIFIGGNSFSDEMDYFTISTLSAAASFGTLVGGRKMASATSNGTGNEGVIGGGYSTFYTSSIEHITISTLSASTTFGNLSVNTFNLGAVADA